MNIIKDGKIIDVTEKAFDVIYKDKGYKPYNADTVKTKKEDLEEANYDKLTKDEIIAKLEEKNINHNPNDLKAELLELLRVDE